MSIKNKFKQQGFTLIELAIVLVIVGVLMGGFIGTLAKRIENSRIAETRVELEDVKTSLIGYAYRNGSLPCSDCAAACAGGTAGDGIEDRNVAGVCLDNNVGMLPWATLGIASGDAWGMRYRYWVDSIYSDSSAGNIFSLVSGNNGGQIIERTADGTATSALATNVVAVVISQGKNGYGGTSTSGAAMPAIPGANVDEADNVNNDNDFVSRPPSADTATTAGGEFDDMVIWISEYELKAKMVEAGALP